VNPVKEEANRDGFSTPPADLWAISGEIDGKEL